MPQSVLSRSQKEKQAMSPLTRACDSCRQKKIRCDVISGGCTRCIKYNTECHFTPISMTRAPRRSGKDKRVEELEQRLKAMEELMKRPAAGQLSGSNSAEPGNHSGSPEGPTFFNHSEAVPSDSGSSLGPTSTLDYPQAPDFGLPSPEASVPPFARNQEGITPPIAKSDSNVSQSPSVEPFPSRDRVLSLVEESFQGFHPAYPLFDKARFMSLFGSLDTSVKEPGQWASLNVVLALTSQFQHETEAIQDMKEDSDSWRFFQTAFALVGQLMTMHVTLWSVQALLGMALVLQGTPNQGPVSLLVAAAMRLAHRMGLHKQCQDPSISAAEIEERKRVFWIAYTLDKDLSLRMGQPSAQDDDDMDVDLPFETDDSLMYYGESTGLNFFNFRARLAMIQAQIYKRLYSTKASKQAVTERVKAATELEAILQSWRASVPLEYMQDYYGGPSLQMTPAGTFRHPVILQLLYFDSLGMVYNSLPALPIYHEPELRRTGDPTEYQLLSAPLDYANDARKAIALLQLTPRRRYACIWAVLYVFVNAATTLLKNTASDPSSPMALSDLKLVEPLLALLTVLANSSKGQQSERVNRMHRNCMELFDAANAAVQSTNLAIMDWDQGLMSGQSQERESLDDFLRRMDSIRSGDDVELDSLSPGISRDFAFAVEQQFQESASY